MTDLMPVPVVILLAVVGVALVVTCAGMSGCMRQLRAYRGELSARAKALRIHRMLEHLGIGLPRYLGRARSIDVEKHLLRCACCEDTQVCDAYLERGENADPTTFCTNFQELVKFQRRGSSHSGT